MKKTFVIGLFAGLSLILGCSSDAGTDHQTNQTGQKFLRDSNYSLATYDAWAQGKISYEKHQRNWYNSAGIYTTRDSTTVKCSATRFNAGYYVTSRTCLEASGWTWGQPFWLARTNGFGVVYERVKVQAQSGYWSYNVSAGTPTESSTLMMVNAPSTTDQWWSDIWTPPVDEDKVTTFHPVGGNTLASTTSVGSFYSESTTGIVNVFYYPGWDPFTSTRLPDLGGFQWEYTGLSAKFDDPNVVKGYAIGGVVSGYPDLKVEKTARFLYGLSLFQTVRFAYYKQTDFTKTKANPAGVFSDTAYYFDRYYNGQSWGTPVIGYPTKNVGGSQNWKVLIQNDPTSLANTVVTSTGDPVTVRLSVPNTSLCLASNTAGSWLDNCTNSNTLFTMEATNNNLEWQQCLWKPTTEWPDPNVKPANLVLTKMVTIPGTSVQLKHILKVSETSTYGIGSYDLKLELPYYYSLSNPPSSPTSFPRGNCPGYDCYHCVDSQLVGQVHGRMNPGNLQTPVYPGTP